MAKTRQRRVGSIKDELLKKSKEAALNAVKVFNDPMAQFKSESFIVLMVIAWTYLLHSYYRSEGIDYRYYTIPGQRKKYDKTKHGTHKYWELEKCLKYDQSPIDQNTKNNLLFLIGLRHEIEHQMTLDIDSYLSSRYQACALNYNYYLKKLSDNRYSLDENMTYSIQFIELTLNQIDSISTENDIPDRVLSYITKFDEALTSEEYNSPQFAYRLLFTRKLVNRPGQADKIIEFIDPESDLAKKIDREYWVKKEVERPKYRPSDVVRIVQEQGFPKLRIQPEHVEMWQIEDAKNPSKGYGVLVQGSWYWYQSWVDRCLKLCDQAGDRYR